MKYLAGYDGEGASPEKGWSPKRHHPPGLAPFSNHARPLS